MAREDVPDSVSQRKAGCRRALQAEVGRSTKGKDKRLVQQMTDAVRTAMTMERYVGDATKCSGCNATRTPRVLKVGGAVMGLFVYDLP